MIEHVKEGLGPYFEIDDDCYGDFIRGIKLKPDLVMSPSNILLELGFPDAPVPLKIFKETHQDKPQKFLNDMFRYRHGTFGGTKARMSLIYLEADVTDRFRQQMAWAFYHNIFYIREYSKASFYGPGMHIDAPSVIFRKCQNYNHDRNKLDTFLDRIYKKK